MVDASGQYWVYLVVAGLMEICWAVSLKLSDGFFKKSWGALTLATVIVSFVCLSKALRGLPVGTAYAVWTGIGAIGSCVLGILVFGEDRSFVRIFFIGLM
jgi:quaternary ammonium compound-resistance protein SugE